MNKVGYFTLSDDASSFYRAAGCFPYINHKGLQLTDISHQNVNSWATILPYDTLIFQRFFHADHVAVIEHAQLMGKRVILDLDDNLLEVPEHNPAYGMYKDTKYATQCIRLADEVWVTTIELKKEFDKYNKNIHVIPNGYNDRLFKKKPFNPNSKTVFYRGGSTHRMDLWRYKGDLVQTASYHPDWRFIYFGLSDDHEFFRENSRNDNVAFTNGVPYIQYMAELQKINPMIFINPLEDHKLNRAKSNISWLEATISGAAFFGNKKLPEFNKSCILDFSDFINSSQRFLGESSNVAMLKHYHDLSWTEIQENYKLSDINEERIRRLLA